jgi:hypothetical protein
VEKCGCLYVAFGRPYLIQALNSFQSLRKVSPSLPVCILTNTFPEAPSEFREWDKTADVWLYVEASNSQNRLFKTDLLRYTPFQKTLYLDCDTEILNDITLVFDLLDYWDIALHLKDEGYSPHKEKGRQIVLDGKAAVFELPHWNSGVILFAKNPRVEEFFTLWNRYYKVGLTQYDQVSLVEAIFRCSCRILSLDGRWNAGAAWGADRPEQKRYVLHYMHDITDRIAQRLINLDREIYSGSSDFDEVNCENTTGFVMKRQQRHLRATGQRWRAYWLSLARVFRRTLMRRPQ